MTILELYNYWNQDIDTRTKDLPLIGSNIQIPLILILYLLIVLKWGPNYMKDRKPYNLKTYIKFYNILQVIMNAYVVIRFAQLGFFEEPTRLCYPVLDYSYDPLPLQMVDTMWLSMITRLFDLTETVVFMLRKKNRQISILHLYHHISVILFGWYILRFYAVKMGMFPIVVNSSVHIVMYSYYFLSSFGDRWNRPLQKVKPFITIMQMVQFVILLCHSNVVYLTSCDIDAKTPLNVESIIVIINFILFYNFYQKTYKTQQKQKQ